MYTLSEAQIDSVKTFIKSLPESMVKGNYEVWLRVIREDGRLATEELEKFVSLANALPQEFQNFPQNFSHSVKNGVAPENAGTDEPKKKSSKKDEAKVSAKEISTEKEKRSSEDDDILKRNKQVEVKQKVEDKKNVVIVAKPKK